MKRRLLIVGWMMHLIRVAMRMILGNCEVLVLLLLLIRMNSSSRPKLKLSLHRNRNLAT